MGTILSITDRQAKKQYYSTHITTPNQVGQMQLILSPLFTRITQIRKPNRRLI